jgi:hypothetical protein
MGSSNFDIFDVTSDDIKDSNHAVSDTNLYKISPENGRNGTYNSIIRFVPFWKEPKKSLLNKWTYFLEDPVSGKKRSVDCPSTENEKSVLRDIFFKLYKSNSIREKELAEKFKRKKTCYSLVDVVKDENKPEYEGKIMVFKFGSKIFDKIQNELAPPLLGSPRKPYDPFTGRPFSLIVTKKGGYTNYDDSYFLDEPWPLKINGKHIEKTQVEADDIINWLKENSPSLEPYLYKKWDEQTQEFVSEVIRNTVPNGALIESTLSGVKTREVVLESSPRSKQSAEKATVSSISIEDDIISSTSLDDDDIKFDDDDDDFYKGLSDD